jgi:hypothetical protein
MSDTGAPWNLPYPESTDLVRDGAQAIEDLAEAVATGLSAAGNAGIGSNVVSVTKTNTFTTTSTSFTNVTGLSVTITPTSASSKILALVSANLATDAGLGVHLQLARGTTGIAIGDAAGSRVRASATEFASTASSQEMVGNVSVLFLDAPATTSPQTYNVQLRRGTAGTAFLNRCRNDTDTANVARTVSSITVIEVAV